MSTPSSQIVIEPFSEAHLAGLTALYNEPAVCRQVLQMPYQSIEVWRQRLTAPREGKAALVAVLEGNVVGHIGLEQSSRVRQRHLGTFGMAIASEWQGKGIGSQLIGAVLDVADNWMNLRRVELTVYADNQAAIALYSKFGFETEGRLRDYAVRDGAYVDALAMARLRR